MEPDTHAMMLAILIGLIVSGSILLPVVGAMLLGQQYADWKARRRRRLLASRGAVRR